MTRIMMNVTEKADFETKILNMNPSDDATRNLYLSMLSSKMMDDVNMLNKIIASSNSNDINHFVRSLPSIRKELQDRFEELVRDKTSRRVGTDIMKDLVWCRPAVSSECLNFLLSCAIEENDEELRDDIVTCLMEDVFTEMYKDRIEEFARENLKNTRRGWSLYAALCMKSPDLISSSRDDEERVLIDLFRSIETSEDRVAFLKNLRTKTFFEGVTSEIRRRHHVEEEQKEAKEEEEEEDEEKEGKSSAASALIELMLKSSKKITKIDEEILLCAVEALCTENNSESLEPIESWRSSVIMLYVLFNIISRIFLSQAQLETQRLNTNSNTGTRKQTISRFL